MSAVADVLEVEGAVVPVEPGGGPPQSKDVDSHPIVRMSARGSWTVIADRERFPLLFELMDAHAAGESIDPKIWSEAYDLALLADLAKNRN